MVAGTTQAKPGCNCQAPEHHCQLVAVTGGPGAGKTAVLEVVRRLFCRHVVVLPESASIIYGGGFPRGTQNLDRRAGQRAIFYVQRQLERIALETGTIAIALCDRGTIDGLAYWPGTEEEFWQEVGSTHEQELSRYAAVIHLRTPPSNGGYNHSNPLRLESAEEAAVIDARILDLWNRHPRRTVIDSSADFLVKVESAVAAIRCELPPCCRLSQDTSNDCRDPAAASAQAVDP